MIGESWELGRCSTRTPLSQKILHTLVKVYVDQATVALVIPEGKKWEEKEKLWGPILETLTVTKLLLPDVPLYRLNPKEEVLSKPCWQTAMYLVSGKDVSPNPMENVSEEIKKIVLKLKPVRTPVAIFGSLGVCIYVPASRHWLISYSPIHLT